MDKKTSNLKYLAVGYPANAALPTEVVQLFEQLGDKINGLGEDCVAKFNAVAKLAESLECVGAMVYDTAGLQALSRWQCVQTWPALLGR